MPNIFPTDYNNEGDAASTDKVWSSDGITNFNLTVDEIGTRNFLDRTTSNLSEGTNLYYTDGRVASSAYATSNDTAVGLRDLISNKKTDFSVINDVGYATTQAIVNYIAALGLDIEGLPAETTIANGDEFAFYDVSATSNKKISKNNLGDSIISGNLVTPGTTTTYVSLNGTRETKTYTLTKTGMYRLAISMTGSNSGSCSIENCKIGDMHIPIKTSDNTTTNYQIGYGTSIGAGDGYGYITQFFGVKDQIFSITIGGSNSPTGTITITGT